MMEEWKGKKVEMPAIIFCFKNAPFQAPNNILIWLPELWNDALVESRSDFDTGIISFRATFTLGQLSYSGNHHIR